MREIDIDDHGLNRDDEPEPGTPGAGKKLCPDCNGTGVTPTGETCSTCDGAGQEIESIGGD
jgi:hypothetical protein